MWGWLPGRVLSGPLYGSGPAGGSALAEGLGGRPCLVRLVLAGGWFVWCWHERHARCCPVGWWWVPLRVWGWHAVGVLGQCALVAWPAFSASLFVGGVGVGVGGLVVNCIVDASILL